MRIAVAFLAVPLLAQMPGTQLDWSQIKNAPSFANSGVVITTFNFTPQHPGGVLTIGSNTVTLRPCPAGVAGGDAAHYLYVSAGSGTAEAVLITGGTCTSGATSGTISFSAVNVHSGAWQIQSATSGVQEALLSTPTQTVIVPMGTYTLYAPVTVQPPTIALSPTIMGYGRSSSVFNVSPDFPLTAAGVFIVGVPGGNSVEGSTLTGFKVKFTQPDTTSYADKIHYPPAFKMQYTKARLINLGIVAGWHGIDATTINQGYHFEDIQDSSFGTTILLDAAVDYIWVDKVEHWVYELTGNQAVAFVNQNNIGMDIGRVDGMNLTDSFFYGGTCMNLHVTGWGVPQVIASNLACDSTWGISQSAGLFYGTNIALGAGPLSSTPMITQNGGSSVYTLLRASTQGTTISAPMISLGCPASSTVSLDISDGFLPGSATDFPIIQLPTSANVCTNYIRVQNSFLSRPNAAYTTAMIENDYTAGSTKMIVTGNHSTVGPSNGSNWIKIANDDVNVVTDNQFQGWGESLPTSLASGHYDTFTYRSTTAFDIGARVSFGTLASLTPKAGSKLQCFNCTAGSSPCTAGAAETIAIYNGTSWRCL